jgi:hypothetical protein
LHDPIEIVQAFIGRRRRVAPLPFWDGLAFGAMACFLAYLYLGMFRTYYLAPVDFIAVLFVGRFVVLSCKTMPSWGRMAAMLLVFLVLLQNAAGWAFAVFE